MAVFTPVPVRVPVPFRSRSGPVPVPFHSFVLRSHLQKLTGPVPVAGLWRVHTCSGTRPERVRLHLPPAHQVFNFGSVFISEGDRVDGFASSTETVSYRWIRRCMAWCALTSDFSATSDDVGLYSFSWLNIVYSVRNKNDHNAFVYDYFMK